MLFDDLDRRMRVFETAHDHCVLPGITIVVRLDGRSFTRLTKETLDYAKPFDERFRDVMILVGEHLMTCGFGVVYAYTQSDEISLLLQPDEESFGRKERKLNSILASEAGAACSLALGTVAAFDSRVCQLPNRETVIDYFRWRQEDAHRNALNSHCYWLLRRIGYKAPAAHQALLGKSVSDKNELLFQHGINFNDLPAWQKRGSGLVWESYTKTGLNPLTGEQVETTRRRIARLLDLPRGDDYARFVEGLLVSNSLP